MHLWQLYLQQLEIPIPPLGSFRIFLSGLALSVTPGKAGELVKAYGKAKRRMIIIDLDALHGTTKAEYEDYAPVELSTEMIGLFCQLSSS